MQMNKQAQQTAQEQRASTIKVGEAFENLLVNEDFKVFYGYMQARGQQLFANLINEEDDAKSTRLKGAIAELQTTINYIHGTVEQMKQYRKTADSDTETVNTQKKAP